MNKAVSWNVDGVGFDAREAAREAARRQGKSLGEWLHTVIADHASELGVEPRDVADQDRIDAVTARLERLSGRSSDRNRPRQRDRLEDLPRLRARRDEADDEPAERTRPSLLRRSPERDPDASVEPARTRRARPMVEETEFLLDEAIDAMERRAARSQKRTEEALASFAKMLETTEVRRERERDAVLGLSKKLSNIEAKLTRSPAHDQDAPIQSTLARLEARLDTIGKRASAESAARQQAAQSLPDGRADNEPIRRLEEKLNTILNAVAMRPQDSAALGGLPGDMARPGAHRRLGDAIAEISRRQRALDDPNAGAVPVPPWAESRKARAAVVREPLQTAPWQQSLSAIQAEIAGLATKIEEMRGHVVRKREEASAAGNADLAALRAEIAAMSRTLRDLAPRATVSQLQESLEQKVAELAERVAEITRNPREGEDLAPAADDIRAMIADLPDATALDKIEGRLKELAQRLDDAIERPRARKDVAALGRQVLELGQKIDAAQAPSGDDRAIEALQHQIEGLSTRFERSEGGLASLGGLQRSVQDLFAHLDQTRASVEVSAAAAAREVLRSVLENPAQQSRAGAPDLAELTALQREADARTQSTLNAVHQTLEHVVGRMSAMEADLARGVRAPAAPRVDTPGAKLAPPAAKPPRPPAAGLDLSSVDPLFDPLFSQRVAKSRSRATAPEGESGRADFIAAARRAAQTAQTDPSVIALRQPAGAPDTEARAGLLAKSRDYVATHKRPVLLSVAAVFVVLGTMAIVQRMTFDGGDAGSVATYAAASGKVADATATGAPAGPPRVLATRGDLTPTALPKAARARSASIPGSDPIQTASIEESAAPALPAFAAQSAIAQPQPTLPAGLTTRAEAGDAAAQYELASRYADGKLVPRDLKLAAKWYQGAANQGSAPAQYRLAALYEKGLGIPQDKERAKALYQQAADAGNPRAMHNLAVLLADGNGKPDYAGAATWFRKAAQYGVHDSEFNLAILLARGLGVDQSLVQSYQWFAVAAAQNDTDAAKKRDEVGDKLSANDLAVAKALAASFQPRTPNAAATDVVPPPGGWDSLGASSHINSARSKISSL